MNQKVHHNTQSPGQTLLPRIDPLVNEAAVEPDPFAHALVEDYLDRVCRPLIDTHSYSVRYDLRQELAQHIRSLIRAYEEMGDAPVVAAEKALAKFGEAETVARQWKLPPATKRRKPMRRWFRQQWQGIAATLAMCTVAILVCGGMSMRTLGVQQAMAREQARAAQSAQSQSTALVTSTGSHRLWASQHQCTDCHRGVVTRSNGPTPGFTSQYWRLRQTTQ